MYQIKISRMVGGQDYAWKVYFRGVMIAAGTDPVGLDAAFCAVGAATMHQERGSA